MDFLAYLRNLVSGGDNGSQENFDIYDFGGAVPEIPDYMTRETLENPLNYDYGVIFPPSDMGFDVTSPEYYPRTADNPMGYAGDASYNQPLPSDFWSTLSKYGGDVVKFFKENPWAGKLLAGGTGALLGALDKRPPSGGGVARPYTSPKTQLTRTIAQGRHGPVALFAAQGGIMQAYRNGGQVRPFPMQDGGFVYTKRAVDGAGGPKGLASLVPSARMIRGPGHGTSDSIPAYIQGPNGRTPARVSNGEAYAPPDGQTEKHYALMKQLERKA